MRKLSLSIMSLATLLAAAGCSPITKSSTARQYDIYVAGDQRPKSRKNLPVIKVWKNGESLYNNGPDGTDGLTDCDANINSIFVSDGDVYVAGNENRNGQSPGAAVVWKNGVPLYDHESNGSKSLMPADRLSSVAEEVVVSGDDVYVMGRNKVKHDSGERFNGTIISVWKNGQLLYDIEPSKEDKKAGMRSLLGFSMFVSGDEIYIAGDKRKTDIFDAIKGFANVWKNGKPLYHNGPGGAEGLTEIGNYNIAPAIFVAGGDVYAAGGVWRKRRQVAMVWKNGKSLYHNGIHGEEGLSDSTVNAFVHSIFVSGDDVYAAGECEYEKDKPIAMVWKNGVPLYEHRNGRAVAIFVVPRN